jgi:murein DD-endopeptidase MepM/ murein hydrolase activator NlpD
MARHSTISPSQRLAHTSSTGSLRTTPLLLLILLLGACSHARPNVNPAERRAAEEASRAAEAATSADAGANKALPLLEYLRTRKLMVPVDGVRVAQLKSTFNEGRSGGRPHNAHDIMASRGTPVLAADDGKVIRVAQNDLGGLTIYATDPAERFVYYYAHLDKYAPDLVAGKAVRKGDVIGYVGSTGNASPGYPHLHFQVAELTDIRRHWEGVPIDALSFFALDGRMRGR